MLKAKILRSVLLTTFLIVICVLMVYLYNHKQEKYNNVNLPKTESFSDVRQVSNATPMEWVDIFPQIKEIMEAQQNVPYKETSGMSFEQAIQSSYFADITGDTISEIMIPGPSTPAGGDCYNILRIVNGNPEFVNLTVNETYPAADDSDKPIIKPVSRPVDGCSVGSGVYSNSFYFDIEHKTVVRESAYLGGDKPKCTAEIFKWDNNEQSLVPVLDKKQKDDAANNYCKGFEHMFQ